MLSEEKKCFVFYPNVLDHTLIGICKQLGMTGKDIIDQIIVVWN